MHAHTQHHGHFYVPSTKCRRSMHKRDSTRHIPDAHAQEPAKCGPVDDAVCTLDDVSKIGAFSYQDNRKQSVLKQAQLSVDRYFYIEYTLQLHTQNDNGVLKDSCAIFCQRALFR